MNRGKDSKKRSGKRSGKKSIRIRLCAVGLLLVFLAACLTGCRDSDAFRRNVYNQDYPDQVEGNMMDNDEENEEENDDIWSVAEDDESESERDYDRTIAQYGEDNSDSEANDVSYNASADDFYTSSQTTDTDSSDLEEGLETTAGDSQSMSDDVEIAYGSDGEGDNGASDGDTTVDSIETDTGSGDDEGDGTGSGSEDGTGSDSEDEDSEDEDSGSTVVDKDADVTEIPTGRTAAALGDIAVLVQMLGGDGTLVATSADFKTEIVSGISAKEIFSDELSDDLIYLGDIDSFSEISSLNFTKMLEAEPDLIFLAEGDSFTSAQQKKLDAAEIEVVYLDDLTEGDSKSDTADDHLLYDLEVIAGALLDRTEYGGQDAEEVFAEYEEWFDDIMSETSTDSTLYTCYFSLYDEDVQATYSYAAENRSYTFTDGLPIAPSGLYLSVGAYTESAGVKTTNTYNLCMGWFSNNNQASLIYFQPYIALISKTAKGGLYESGTVGFFSGNGNADTNSNPYPLSKVSSSIYLGSASYPAILTASQFITEAIEDSRDGKGIFSGYYGASWFRYSTGNEIVTIENTDYDVYTVPYGVSSWTDGAAESPLLTAWISAKFYDTYDDDEIKTKVQEFYETFYRYELSGSEANKILAGREE